MSYDFCKYKTNRNEFTIRWRLIETQVKKQFKSKSHHFKNCQSFLKGIICAINKLKYCAVGFWFLGLRSA